jgi:aminoglycoside phosphotransferase (APT) family kinase protein
MVSEANSAVEKACLTWLDGSGCAPRLLGSFMVGERTALHMEFVEGRMMLDSIIESSLRGDVQEILPLFTVLGGFLAALHSLPVEKEGLEAVREIPEIQLALSAPQPFIEPALAERAAELTALFTEIDDRQVLLHGDYGYHNVLIRDNATCCLVGWELAAIGHPSIDIGNLLFWTHLHFPEIARGCVQHFLDGYGIGENEYSPEAVRAFVILQVWRLLGLVRHDFPEAVKKEWNRRLAWTLEHSFL